MRKSLVLSPMFTHRLDPFAESEKLDGTIKANGSKFDVRGLGQSPIIFIYYTCKMLSWLMATENVLTDVEDMLVLPDVLI